MSIENIIVAIVTIVLVIMSIILHEISHGYAAYKMGDMTAKSMGRLSLNPLKHIDPFGSVLLPVVLYFTSGLVIGYAKPVPYNPNRFENKRKGEVIVGLAGPACNLVLAIIFAILGRAAKLLYFSTGGGALGYWLFVICASAVSVNLCLMFFNLIPLPPLDGSSIIAPFLSDKALHSYYKVQQYSLPILLGIIILFPMVFHFDPISVYLQFTAGNLTDLLLGL